MRSGNTAEAEALLLSVIDNHVDQVEARQLLAMVYSFPIYYMYDT